MNRGKGFYETREVNDLTHLLRVIANPRDEISWPSVLRSPLVEVSDEALLRLKMSGDKLGCERSRAPILRTSAPRISRASRFRRPSARMAAAARVRHVRPPAAGGHGRLRLPGDAANIDKFLAQARDAAARMSLDEFVDELALVRESNPREPDAPPEDSANAVKVMTVHSAKGLEFPVVFVAAHAQGDRHRACPSSPSPGITAWARAGAIRRAREDKDDLFQHAHPPGAQTARRGREQPPALRGDDARGAAPGAQLLGHGPQARQLGELVAERLALDLSAPCDQLAVYHAPDGQPWKARVRMVGQARLACPLATRSRRPPPPETPASKLRCLSVSEQQDTNATVTALSLFASCPRKYYLAHYLGFEGGPRKPGDSALDLRRARRPSAGEFGTQVHSLLAGNAVPEAEPEALRLADVFRQSPLGRRAARATRVEREFDFLMAVEDLVIRGQVDLWFEEGGELVIVDYKTDDGHRRRGPSAAPRITRCNCASTRWPWSGWRAARRTAPSSTSCVPTPSSKWTSPLPY